MNKFKKVAATIYFQIGVNVIGIPDFHKHILGRIGSDIVIGSKFHK